MAAVVAMGAVPAVRYFGEAARPLVAIAVIEHRARHDFPVTR
jgi:hypothetical protein